MAGRRKVLSPDHARALIKQAIGIIEGDRAIEAEAVAEIAAVEAAHHAATDAASPQETKNPPVGASPPVSMNPQMRRCRLHLRGADGPRSSVPLATPAARPS